MRKELAEAHFQTPHPMVYGEMVKGQYPPDSATKETLLGISNAENTSVYTRSNEGQKSPPIEKLDALV